MRAKRDKQGRIELKEVSVDTQGPQRENSWKVSAANNTRQRRVSSIFLNACIPDGTKEYNSDTITKTKLASMVLFMVRCNNNFLHDNFITWIRVMLYLVTATYIVLRSSVPMLLVVGMKYLLNTGGPLSLPAYMYWGFLFVLGLTGVLLSKNIMESYIQTRFLHRSIKQIINVSDSVDLDASSSSLQKVSIALKKYIETSYEHYGNFIVSTGCVVCSIVVTFNVNTKLGDILLCILVVLNVLHLVEDTFEYYQHCNLESATKNVSICTERTMMEEIMKTDVQLDIVLRLRQRNSHLSSVMKCAVSLIYFSAPLLLLYSGLNELEEGNIEPVGLCIATFYYIFAFLSAYDGHSAVLCIVKNTPFYHRLVQFNSANDNCLLKAPKDEEEGFTGSFDTKKTGSTNDNTSKKEMVRVQSTKHLKKVVSTRAQCGGICVLVIGLLSVIYGITALIITSQGVSDLGCQNVTVDCKFSPETNGVRVEISENQIFSWHGCVFEKKPHEILNVCAYFLLLAESGDGDISLGNKTARSEEEIILEGSSIEVEIVASYLGWRGVPESYSVRLTRDDIQSIKTEFKDMFDRAYSEDDDDIPQGTRMRLLQFVENRALINSPTLIQENTDVHFTTCLTCNHKQYGQYKVTVVVDSGRYSGTKDTLSIQLHGASKRTSFTSLGSHFISNEERKIELDGLIDVGKVEMISVTTSGRDAVLFKSIYIENSAPEETSGPAKDAPGTSKELKIGSEVIIQSGKYTGCPGKVETFSATTEKAKVCRDCNKVSTNGVACCGSTARTQCWYYADDDVKVIAQSKPSSNAPSKTHDIHKSYFAFESALKCVGSKRAGTWTCTVTLNAQAPPSAPTQGSSTCGKCPKPGDSDYQGVAPEIYSNFESLIPQRRRLEKTLSTFATNSHVFISMPTSIYDGCSGIIYSTTTKKYKIQKDCTETSRKGVACCAASGSSIYGYYYPNNVEEKSASKYIFGPLNYSFGQLWVDRRKRGVLRFKYEARKDCGCFDRHGTFSMAPLSSLSDTGKSVDIQQYSTRSYPKYCVDPTRNSKAWSMEGLSASQIKDQCNEVLAYDRGHLIPANHFDHSKLMIKESNFMINILPQINKMNRGAWLETEMIIECLRDKEALTVYGGVVYPTQNIDSTLEARDNWFTKTHGVSNPHYFWKIIVASRNGIYKSDNGVIAFWIPNTVEATAKRTSSYVVSLTELENKLSYYGALNEKFTSFSTAEKNHVPSYWAPLAGCDRS